MPIKKNNRLFLSPPHMSGFELEYISEAIQSNYIAPLGPQVETFEKEFSRFTGIRHCVALSCGTAAMHLALRQLDVGPGDEVLASTLTFIGSISPITFLGAIPVFIDCDYSTWNMDSELLEKELENCKQKGKLPKAVVPTDLYGQCCNLSRIVEVCDRFEIPVICDSAEALGSRYYRSDTMGRPTENAGDKTISGRSISGASIQIESYLSAGKGAKAAIYSFNGNKIITTSCGGMLASDEKKFIENARFLSQQARDPEPHYEHSEIGYNYRMSNILAAIGCCQLKVLDERVTRKREIFEYYRNALRDLPGIQFMPEAPYNRCNRWLTVILISPENFGADRETVRLALEEENIESRPVWKPMHLQPVFNPQISRSMRRTRKTVRYPARAVGGSVAEDLYNRGLCLPSGTSMTKEDMDRTISTILSCRK